MNQIDFASKPPIGTVIMLDDQGYELIEAEPYRRLDGAPSWLLRWSTSCPDCGTEFQQSSGLVSHAFNRRCTDCRKLKRRPVKGRRGRRLKIRVIYP